MNPAKFALGVVLDRIIPALQEYIERKTIDQMRARLWAAMVRLREGGAFGDFLATFARVIDQQLTEAWNLGADEVGVSPAEMTNDDINILRSIIANEFPYIQRLGIDIMTDKQNGQKRDQFDAYYGSRVNLWANRYLETLNRARMHFGSKERLEWFEGPTSDKCVVCVALNGFVAFGYEWEVARLHPQMPPNQLLACKGWGCQCQLRPTTKRRTRNAMSRLLDIALIAGGL